MSVSLVQLPYRMLFCFQFAERLRHGWSFHGVISYGILLVSLRVFLEILGAAITYVASTLDNLGSS